MYSLHRVLSPSNISKISEAPGPCKKSTRSICRYRYLFIDQEKSCLHRSNTLLVTLQAALALGTKVGVQRIATCIKKKKPSIRSRNLPTIRSRKSINLTNDRSNTTTTNEIGQKEPQQQKERLQLEAAFFQTQHSYFWSKKVEKFIHWQKWK